MNPRFKARLAGAVVIVVVFGAGVLAGFSLGRRPSEGLQINLRVTDELPRELLDLELSAAQRDTLSEILLNGRRRASIVLNGIEPRMREAMDSLRAEVNRVLTPEQRRRLEAERAKHGADIRIVDTNVVLDTARRKKGD